MELISIPDYFKNYVDPTVDLNVTHSVRCPFHGETEGKSFTYSPEKQIWRCWGKCHAGGDVIALHLLNNKYLKTRENAKRSLMNLLGISVEEMPKFTKKEVHVDDVYIKRQTLYNQALRVAQTPEQWVQLDYILGKYPFDYDELSVFVNGIKADES